VGREVMVRVGLQVVEGLTTGKKFIQSGLKKTVVLKVF